MKKVKILVLQGPNLNLLGEREPGIYGRTTLPQLHRQMRLLAKGAQLRFFQSNSESELIDKLHQQRKWAEGILFNPAAFTHTSVALRDALLAVDIPFVEVHLSNTKKREKFRRINYFSDIALKVFQGKGVESYLEALQYLLLQLKSRL